MSGSPEENLEKLQGEVFELYTSDKVKTRFSILKLPMLSLKAKGDLRGKAAEIKCLGPVLLKVWDKRAGNRAGVYSKIRLLLHLNVLLDEKIDSVDTTSFCVPRDVREYIANTCHAFLMRIFCCIAVYSSHRRGGCGVTEGKTSCRKFVV
eukprot:3628440-Pyramimonas_sp.AAC.1